MPPHSITQSPILLFPAPCPLICHQLLPQPLPLRPTPPLLVHLPLMNETGVEKGRGRETEQLCLLLGTESEKERGREKGEEVVEAAEEEQVVEVEERIWGVFRC